MRRLGYSHFGYDRDLETSRSRGDLARCLEWAEPFDSFDDRPWFSPDLVAAFRVRFPGSYYVLLERDEVEWVGSYLTFTNRTCSPTEALGRYRAHVRQVLEILADEPNVLRLNVCAGEGYEKLCPFLKVAAPDEPFPWVRPER